MQPPHRQRSDLLKATPDAERDALRAKLELASRRASDEINRACREALTTAAADGVYGSSVTLNKLIDTAHSIAIDQAEAVIEACTSVGMTEQGPVADYVWAQFSYFVDDVIETSAPHVGLRPTGFEMPMLRYRTSQRQSEVRDLVTSRLHDYPKNRPPLLDRLIRTARNHPAVAYPVLLYLIANGLWTPIKAAWDVVFRASSN